jgi:ER membrane protein complex subunit 1
MFMKALPLLHFPLRAGPHRIVGHQIAFFSELGDKVVGYQTWSFSSSPDEKIQTMFPPVRGPVASVGKVLGNHTTLYKYLNPRLFVVLTESPLVSPKTCGVYLVDSTKGSIIYHANVPASAGTCDVKASLTENWLVYHYYEDFAGVGQAKGYRVVSVELYEGAQIDDKTSR